MNFIYLIAGTLFLFCNISYANNQRPVERETYYASLLIGPHWSSKFYSSDINFEQGKLTPFSFGLDIGAKITPRWFVDSYFYYLPTTLNEADSGVDFSSSNSVSYTNNIYGVRLGYLAAGGSKYRLSAITGIANHIIGGLNRTGLSSITIDKYSHLGMNIGGRLEYKVAKGWAFDSDLSYIVPLSVDSVDSFSANLWYRALVAIKWRWNENLRLAFEYQLVYHSSDFTFFGDNSLPDSANKAESEFFIQTLMIGLKYRFDKI